MSDVSRDEPGRRPALDADDIQPLDADGVNAVTIGTLLWLIAFFVLLAMRHRLDDRGAGWWIGTCAVGFGLGCLGLWYVRRRRTVYRAAALAQTNESDGATPQE
jgi:Protein of unknown function (DUF2530)